MGSLIKMNIVAYSDDKFSKKASAGNYVFMLNPESLKWDRSIEYNDQQVIDANKGSSKYKATPGEKLSFDVVIDCTGVVDSTRVDLPAEIKQLKKVVYDFNGTIHRPNYVSINWGNSMAFEGVLTSFSTSYSLFKPDGTPLRAKISLGFSSYTDPVTAAKEAAKSSPDLTHHIDVVAGDTLPLLSERVFNSSEYFLQIAQSNGLNKFRHLKPGTRLIVPPLVSEA